MKLSESVAVAHPPMSVWAQGESLPILLALCSVNQRLPSGPLVIPRGRQQVEGRANCCILPAGVMRPILFPTGSVNQRLPSGPLVIPAGPQLWLTQIEPGMTGRGNSWYAPR